MVNEKRTSEPPVKGDLPYDAANAGDVIAFWETALSHRGVEELRAKHGRPPRTERTAENKSR
jgi:hypothetical protein